jgi:hypothetical protein
MKNLLLPGILALAIAGCGSPNRTRNDSSKDSAPSAGFHREHDPAFSSQERGIIVAAQRHLAHSGKRPGQASRDAFYRVRSNANGYEVFVVYVTGYDGGKPVFTPCVHNQVFLERDGSLVKVLTGPECWASP